MDTTFTFVVNPAAGGGRARQCLQAIRSVLDTAGARYLTHESKSLADAGRLAAEAGGKRGDQAGEGVLGEELDPFRHGPDLDLVEGRVAEIQHRVGGGLDGNAGPDRCAGE